MMKSFENCGRNGAWETAKKWHDERREKLVSNMNDVQRRLCEAVKAYESATSCGACSESKACNVRLSCPSHHFICKGCVKKRVESDLCGETECKALKCNTPGCEQKLSVEGMCAIVGEEIFEQWLQKINTTEKALKCVLCYKNDRNVLFRECGHVLTCDVCASVLAQGSSPSCPYCRVSILTLVPVYVPAG